MSTLLVLPIWVYGFNTIEAPVVEGNSIETNVKETTPSPTVKVVPKAPVQSTNTVLLAIAKCEGVTQFNPDGTVVRGRVNPKDVGLYQINEKYHLATSIKMGYDIYTLEGNTAYAEYLYKTQGAKPWSASAKCHGYY